MRRNIFVMILAATLLGAVWQAAGRADEAKPADKKEAAPESRIKQDTNGNTVIKLDEETQKRIALKTEALVAAQFSPELKAYGEVMDPTPLAALITETSTAQSAYTASSNELTRLKTLSGSGNASARAVQTAEATALHDQLALQSARDRLKLSWGTAVAERDDLPAFVQSLATLETALVRVDVPAGQRFEAPPTIARVAPLSGKSVPAQVLGAAMAVDPQTQGQGFILQIKPNTNHFLPGEAVTGWLQTSGESLSGVVVPRDAVVRLAGAGWVYVAGTNSNFTRMEIALDRPVENGWFVTNNVGANDQLVVTGAAALLSEELKAATGPPD